MRIGILTYHSIYNFGANLQAYSTVGYLKSNGFDPIVINYLAKDLEDGYKKGHPSVQVDTHKKFIEDYFPLTELCRSSEDVARAIEKNNIQAVIIGSDAVLQHQTLLSRIKLTRKGISIKEKRSNLTFPNPFWGGFIQHLETKIPVSVMSASSQNMNFRVIRGTLKRRMGDALLRFREVKVRDEWTGKMVSYFTRGKLKPDVTPDPVFAYNHNIKDQISREEILEKFSLPEKYILFSFKTRGTVSEDWIKSFQAILEKNNLTGVILTMPFGVIFKNPPVKVISTPLCPREWYALIKYSSGYIGENMHPVVVALHNSVPFFAFDSYGIVRYRYFVNEKSSKIHNLLHKAGFLENRVCNLGKNYTCPSPEDVFNRIKTFDYQKCTDFSARQLNDYLNMMNSITSF